VPGNGNANHSPKDHPHSKTREQPGRTSSRCLVHGAGCTGTEPPNLNGMEEGMSGVRRRHDSSRTQGQNQTGYQQNLRERRMDALDPHGQRLRPGRGWGLRRERDERSAGLLRGAPSSRSAVTCSYAEVATTGAIGEPLGPVSTMPDGASLLG
jgi:hypothetical protein